MDGKLVLGFIADLLYMKNVITAEELESIYDSRNAEDLENIIEDMLRGGGTCWQTRRKI